MSEIGNPLQAASNVIELKPGHKYLLVFKDTHYVPEQIDMFARQLHALGFDCFAIATYDEGDIQVIEVPDSV